MKYILVYILYGKKIMNQISKYCILQVHYIRRCFDNESNSAVSIPNIDINVHQACLATIQRICMRQNCVFNVVISIFFLLSKVKCKN